MSSYKSIRIDVSDAKARKIASGKAVNLTATEVQGKDETLHVHPLTYEKLMRAKRANKGCRLQLTEGEIVEDIAQGGSIFKSIWRGVKSLWKPVLKPMLSAALDTGANPLGTYSGNPELTQGVRKGIRSLTGVGIAETARVARHSGFQPESSRSLSAKRLGKGTPEMKAHMAHLRSMRGSSTGLRAKGFKL